MMKTILPRGVRQSPAAAGIRKHKTPSGETCGVYMHAVF